jgi:hypothetical protein
MRFMMQRSQSAHGMPKWNSAKPRRKARCVLRYNHLLEIQFLQDMFHSFADPFDADDTRKLIETAAGQKDHASRLAMLWAAVRQLCSVPYISDEFRSTHPLWEKALNEWVRSAAWYGLHNNSPIGLLAAVNSLIRIRAQAPQAAIPPTSPQHIHGTHGARASALYSLAKRCWNPMHRWALLGRALDDVELAMAANPRRLGGTDLARRS